MTSFETKIPLERTIKIKDLFGNMHILSHLYFYITTLSTEMMNRTEIVSIQFPMIKSENGFM